MAALKKYIADIPDFPKAGVMFRDISPLLENHFSTTIDELATLYSQEEWNDIDAIAGIDARGFIFASALSVKLKKRFIMIRKAGKLPPPVVQRSYKLEYGEATLEMKTGEGKLVVIDDVLATGGTLEAATELCQQAGYEVKGLAALIDLRFLNNFSWNGIKPRASIIYEE